MNSTQELSFKTVFLYAFGFLVFGLSALILLAFYDSMLSYSSAVAVSFIAALRVLLAFGVGYIGFMLYLSFEYKAIQNERLKRDNVEILERVQADGDKSDKELDILTAYNELIESGQFSLNRLALAVFGKKGGTYNAQIRQVLYAHDIEI